MSTTSRKTVHHLRCRPCLQGDEWEEKWGEWWASLGRANKWADKWGKDGGSVWHEKWGEDYDGEGGCIKYTDKVRQGLSGCLSVPCSAQTSRMMVIVGWRMEQQMMAHLGKQHTDRCQLQGWAQARVPSILMK